MSEEDLKQVADGGIFLTGKNGTIESWDIINDFSSDVIGRLSVDTAKENGYNKASDLAIQRGMNNHWYTWSQFDHLRTHQYY